MLGRLGQRISMYPSDPVHRLPKEALFELLRATDFYAEEVTTCEDMDLDKIKVLRGVARPRDLLGRLSGEARALRENFETAIERSEAELEAKLVAGELPSIDPYLGSAAAFRSQLPTHFPAEAGGDRSWRLPAVHPGQDRFLRRHQERRAAALGL